MYILFFLLNKKCPLTEKSLRLIENTTDVVFSRREFVQLYRGTLSPLPKTGVFLEFFYTPRSYTASYLRLFFGRVFLICTTVTTKSVTSIIFDQNNISTMSFAPPLQISKVDLYHRATRPLMSFVHGRSYGPDH